MKSDTIILKNEVQEVDIEKILNQVEKVAQFGDLTGKQAQQLRLLAEELIGFERGILGFSDGEFYIENNDMEYRLYLHADVKMDMWDREKAAGLSSTGQNAAYKGFKGKIRKIVDIMCEFDTGSVSETNGFLVNPVSAGANCSYDHAWAMSDYVKTVAKNTEEWDMLEHSILANMADDVIVATRNDFIDIIIVKKF